MALKNVTPEEARETLKALANVASSSLGYRDEWLGKLLRYVDERTVALVTPVAVEELLAHIRSEMQSERFRVGPERFDIADAMAPVERHVTLALRAAAERFDILAKNFLALSDAFIAGQNKLATQASDERVIARAARAVVADWERGLKARENGDVLAVRNIQRLQQVVGDASKPSPEVSSAPPNHVRITMQCAACQNSSTHNARDPAIGPHVERYYAHHKSCRPEAAPVETKACPECNGEGTVHEDVEGSMGGVRVRCPARCDFGRIPIAGAAGDEK